MRREFQAHNVRISWRHSSSSFTFMRASGAIVFSIPAIVFFCQVSQHRGTQYQHADMRCASQAIGVKLVQFVRRYQAAKRRSHGVGF